jgi:hypothetical protein
MFFLDDLLGGEEVVVLFLWLLFGGGGVTLEGLLLFCLFLYDFGLLFGLLADSGDGDRAEGFEVDL